MGDLVSYSDLLAVLDGEAFARGRLGFQPDPVQASLLRPRHKQLILNCTRQWGKSTVAAAKVVHHAWSHPESLALIVCPSERQGGEFLKKAAAFLRRLGIPRRGDGLNRVSLALPNESRIVAVPAKDATVRGFSDVTLMIVDEAAQVPDQHYEAMTPMLGPRDGDLWLISTPWVKAGFFWEAWSNEDPEWTRISVKATECPRLSAAFLAKERKRKGEAQFRREFLCEFFDAEASLFGREELFRLMHPSVRALWAPEGFMR
ncbi:MAG: terminase family protein [Acidobacteria bacterium]|nr:terminase family protein [Acidobacteriota bacterium]